MIYISSEICLLISLRPNSLLHYISFNLNDMTLQECEHFKVEMEMKKNYYGAFMSNVLTDEMTEKMESICGCESNQ